MDALNIVLLPTRFDRPVQVVHVKGTQATEPMTLNLSQVRTGEDGRADLHARRYEIYGSDGHRDDRIFQRLLVTTDTALPRWIAGRVSLHPERLVQADWFHAAMTRPTDLWVRHLPVPIRGLLSTPDQRQAETVICANDSAVAMASNENGGLAINGFYDAAQADAAEIDELGHPLGEPLAPLNFTNRRQNELAGRVGFTTRTEAILSYLLVRYGDDARFPKPGELRDRWERIARPCHADLLKPCPVNAGNFYGCVLIVDDFDGDRGRAGVTLAVLHVSYRDGKPALWVEHLQSLIIHPEQANSDTLRSYVSEQMGKENATICEDLDNIIDKLDRQIAPVIIFKGDRLLDAPSGNLNDLLRDTEAVFNPACHVDDVKAVKAHALFGVQEAHQDHPPAEIASCLAWIAGKADGGTQNKNGAEHQHDMVSVSNETPPSTNPSHDGFEDIDGATHQPETVSDSNDMPSNTHQDDDDEDIDTESITNAGQGDGLLTGLINQAAETITADDDDIESETTTLPEQDKNAAETDEQNSGDEDDQNDPEEDDDEDSEDEGDGDEEESGDDDQGHRAALKPPSRSNWLGLPEHLLAINSNTGKATGLEAQAEARREAERQKYEAWARNTLPLTAKETTILKDAIQASRDRGDDPPLMLDDLHRKMAETAYKRAEDITARFVKGKAATARDREFKPVAAIWGKGNLYRMLLILHAIRIRNESDARGVFKKADLMPAVEAVQNWSLDAAGTGLTPTNNNENDTTEDSEYGPENVPPGATAP